MPLEEEEAMDADEEAEELQGTSCDKVMYGFLQKLFPLVLGPAVSHIPTTALK